MTNDVTKMPKPMNEEEMIDTLKGLVFGTFDRTTAKEREALDMVIKEVERTRWIPVSERLPKEDEWVLITFDDGIEIALLDDDGWCYSSVGNDDWIAEHPPVAWQPLPQPYRESEDK